MDNLLTIKRILKNMNSSLSGTSQGLVHRMCLRNAFKWTKISGKKLRQNSGKVYEQHLNWPLDNDSSYLFKMVCIFKSYIQITNTVDNNKKSYHSTSLILPLYSFLKTFVLVFLSSEFTGPGCVLVYWFRNSTSSEPLNWSCLSSDTCKKQPNKPNVNLFIHRDK